MRPRRIKGVTETVFRLPGGTEDNDLFADVTAPSEEVPTGLVLSYWRPEPEELAMLNAGGYIELGVYAYPPPPVTVGVCEFHEHTLAELEAEDDRLDEAIRTHPRSCSVCLETSALLPGTFASRCPEYAALLHRRNQIGDVLREVRRRIREGEVEGL